MTARHYLDYRANIHDFLDCFNKSFDFFAKLLIENEVDVVLYSSMPHEGPDLVLYELARAMNIQVIMVSQSLFPDRFFILHTIEDFGLFEEIPQIYPAEKIEVKKQEESPFYRKNIVYPEPLLTILQKVENIRIF